MASFSAAGVNVSFGGGTVFARSASASSQQSLEGVKVLGKALAQGTVPSGPLETTANIEYYIQGSDPGWSIVNQIMNNPSQYVGGSVTIGGASLSKMYLSSYSLTAEPEGLVTASVSFVSYEDNQEMNIQGGDGDAGSADLSFAHGQGGGGGGGNLVGFSAEASFEWEPVLTMGSAGKPNGNYIFNGGSVSLTVRTANGGGSVSYCPSTQTATATAGAVCGGGSQTYSLGGKISGTEISAEVGGFAEGAITVTKTL
jgi:hypothetical protein